MKSALENGADVETIHTVSYFNCINHNMYVITQEVIHRMTAISTRNTPLHLAVKFSNGPEIVQLLLENKANPNALDDVSELLF